MTDDVKKVAIDFNKKVQPLAERVAGELKRLGYESHPLKDWMSARDKGDWDDLARYSGGVNLLRYGKGLRDEALQLQQALLQLDPPCRVELKTGSLYFQNSEWSLSSGFHFMLVKDEPGFGRPDAPIEHLENFVLSPSVERILERSRALATGARAPINLTTSFVLLAALDIGQVPDSSGTTRFFSQAVTGGASPPYITIKEEYLQKKGAQEAEPEFKGKKQSTGFEPEIVSGYLVDTMESAKRFAQQTGRDEKVHARHLFAALLAHNPGPEPSGAQTRLKEMGLSLSKLRESYLAYVQRLGVNTETWNAILLGEMTEIRQLFGYSPDDAHGDRDLIGIDREVDALATLIAARTVVPPLSIGLFGEWGSGKTFFMRRLRKAVDRLAQKAQHSGQMQKDIGFYKRIVQIEFNAWHYVEGNLWASLVEHIFDNLRIAGEPEETASEKLKEHLIKELGYEEKRQMEASKAEEAARKAVTKTRRALTNAKNKLKNQTNKLTELTAENVLKNFILPEAGEKINTVLAELDLEAVNEAEKGAQELQAALDEARSVVERGGGLLTSLVRGKDRARRFIWLLVVLIGGPAVGFIAGLILNLLEQEAAAPVTTVASSLATTLAGGAAWLRNQAVWIDRRLTQIAGAQKELDDRVAKRLAENVKQIKELEQQLQILNANLQAAQQENRVAQERHAEASRAVEEASVANLLASYVSDRAESNVYRQHLGVLALVRDDFEKMSELMEEENWRLAPELVGEPPVRWKSQKYATLEDEKKDEARRINRIVLYIDDLDRCPPNKVVEVLQAVHLLLAFPLFVVVVGVDARWIRRSLETRYRELLLAGDGAEPMENDADREIAGKATTGDYLEKIFQIPFWLRPMEEKASQRMVDGLLRGSLAALQPRTDAAGIPHLPGSPKDEGGGEKTGQVDADRGGKIQGEDQGEAEIKDAITHKPLEAATAEEPHDEGLNPTRLDIEDKEHQFIVQLTPLLSRSPRTLKRFINVYRLIKAGLSPYEERLFLHDDPPPGNYQVVLFLLAIDTGLPAVAPSFFQALRKENQVIMDKMEAEDESKDAAMIQGLEWLFPILDEDEELQQNQDWLKLKDWLQPANENQADLSPRFTCTLVHMDRWAPRVTQHSFLYNYA